MNDRTTMRAISLVIGAPPVRTSAMASEIARMVVRSFMEAPKPPDANDTDQLSPREMEILALVAEGCPNKEIAARLFISNATVRTHLMHVYEKLHVRCRTEAAAKYFRSKSSSAPTRPAGAN